MLQIDWEIKWVRVKEMESIFYIESGSKLLSFLAVTALDIICLLSETYLCLALLDKILWPWRNYNFNVNIELYAKRETVKSVILFLQIFKTP